MLLFEVRNMKKTKQKTYNIFQNCAFMVGRAWRDCKSVLAIVLGLIFCGAAANLLELEDLRRILERLSEEFSGLSAKDQAALAAGLCREAAAGREIDLRLRKPPGKSGK